MSDDLNQLQEQVGRFGHPNLDCSRLIANRTARTFLNGAISFQVFDY